MVKRETASCCAGFLHDRRWSLTAARRGGEVDHCGRAVGRHLRIVEVEYELSVAKRRKEESKRVNKLHNNESAYKRAD